MTFKRDLGEDGWPGPRAWEQGLLTGRKVHVYDPWGLVPER